MKFFSPENLNPASHTRSILMRLAASYLFLYSIILTLSQAVRLHTWQTNYPFTHWLGFTVWLAGFLFLYHHYEIHLPDSDPYLLPVTALLTGWGLLTIWRLDESLGFHQTLWLALGLTMLVYALRAPQILESLRRYKYFWLTSALLLTGLTFFLGTYPGGQGPHLWLGCCGFYVQPSEPLKLLLIVYMAAYLADRMPFHFGLISMLAPTLVMGGAAVALLLAQRDLGTATLFILIYTITLYLASGRRRVLLLSLAGTSAALVVGYRLFDVVRIRVDAWLNPWLDPAGRSFQIVQSLLAVASGGLMGSGPGLGSPSLVPVAQSDFIFSAISEETGLLGASALLALTAILVGRGFRSAINAASNFQRYLAAGVSAYFAAQAILIVGGNLRLLPLTGVTLPFVSYGGSSLLSSLAGLLILAIVSRTTDEEPAPLQNNTPYLIVSGGIMAALLALSLSAGWWAVIRQGDVLIRSDNPRRAIADRYSPRGSLLDRHNEPIDITSGSPGSYQRSYLYAPLSATTGYNNPLYGAAGLENGLDNYLRGLQGNPSSLVWWNQLVYNQPPPGLNVRLSLDLEVQRKADELLAGQKGALVLLNANTGEILALASHPNFDPNTLNTDWDRLLKSPDAPLLNRATQGTYPPGAALGPFLLTTALSADQLPDLPKQLNASVGGLQLACARAIQDPSSWGSAVSSGCPNPLILLSKQISAARMENLFRQLNFSQTPQLPIPAALASIPSVEKPDLAAVGQEKLLVSPLQMALAAAALTGRGSQPTPLLALAVNTPYQGWVVLPHNDLTQALNADQSSQAVALLARPGTFLWDTAAVAQTSNQTISWYLAGTLPTWQGTPLALVVLLESNNPAQAEMIGTKVIDQAMNVK